MLRMQLVNFFMEIPPVNVILDLGMVMAGQDRRIGLSRLFLLERGLSGYAFGFWRKSHRNRRRPSSPSGGIYFFFDMDFSCSDGRFRSGLGAGRPWGNGWKAAGIAAAMGTHCGTKHHLHRRFAPGRSGYMESPHQRRGRIPVSRRKRPGNS